MRELNFTPNAWTPELEERALYLYMVEGYSMQGIQDEIGINKRSVGRRLKQWGVYAEDRGFAAKYYTTMGLELPKEYQPRLKPTRDDNDYMKLLGIPEIDIASTSGATEVSLHWSDTHFPFHDPAAIAILYAIAEDVRPDRLIAQGDLIDLYQISTHRPPLETKLKPWEIDIQDGVDMLVNHLAIMSSFLRDPKGQKVLMYGNHEDRFERLLADMQLNAKTAALMRIPRIQEVLNLDYILGLEESGWESHQYLEGDRFLLHDRLLCIHGYRTVKYATNAHLQMYGKSVLFGHSHRIQSFTSRDLRGTDAAWNIGCLCDLNPHWRARPDWHQGFAVVTWKRQNGDWLFNVEQVRIHDGVAIFRDKVYKG